MRLRRFLSIVAAAGVLFAAGRAAALGGTIDAGAEGGYVQLFRSGGGRPLFTDGGGAAFRAGLGLNEYVGVSFDGLVAWLLPYAPVVTKTNEDGEETTVQGSRRESVRLRGAFVSLFYAIDVARVLPFASIGVGSVRISETVPSGEIVDWEVALRISIGFDYRLLDHLALGATLHLDSLMRGTSEYEAATSLFAHAAFVIDTGALGGRRAGR